MQPKHIVIVGGTSGSGRVLVRRFSEHQNIVSLLGRHASPEVQKQIPGIHFYQVDLGDPSEILNTIKRFVTENGKITHLIFFQRFRGDGDSWEGELQISLTATKLIIEACAELFDHSQENSIVIISSSAGHFIHTEQPIEYHIAKAGLNQMVRYYAVQLGPKGIRVNCVSPSMVIKEESKQFYAEQEELRRIYDMIIPLQRMGNGEDIADVVEFLCSSKSLYITGQEIIIDGGLSLIGQSTLAKQLGNIDNRKIS
jgi:NAD(P)-dependent dehydrogenase (short-subunit alcohol dehydrogenase family)